MNVRVTYADCFAAPATTVNEDIATVWRDAAWVLDASSGLTGRHFTDSATDGLWFVQFWDEYLRTSIDDFGKPLSGIIKSGMEMSVEKFREATGQFRVAVEDEPSCSASLIRLNSGSLEYFVLGDCSVLVAEEDGDTHFVHDRRVSDFDRRAIAAISEYQSQHAASFAEARLAARALLLGNRRKKNTHDGYWILGFDEEAIDYAYTGRIDISRNSSVLLMTDGFAQAWDTFKVYPSPLAMLESARRSGLQKAYEALRVAAERDAECKRFPRLKPIDDAGAVLIEVRPTGRA